MMNPEMSELPEQNIHWAPGTAAFIKRRHFCVGKRQKLHNNCMVRVTLILEKSAEFDVCGSEKALQNQSPSELGRL